MSEIKIQDAEAFRYLWDNNGNTGDGSFLSVKDALASSNAGLWFPKVISNIVKEAQEPLLVGANLLQRVNYSAGQTITFPSMGALQAADIGEGMEYPERSAEMGGGTVTANVAKSGLAVRFTEEMLKYSQFDVMGMHLRQAGYALGRWKEEKIFNAIRNNGQAAFDNLNPTASLNGVTTGRSMDGTGNGSITMDDLFDAYAGIMSNGFHADTLLMHPLTWTMFVKDATLRSFALQSGGGTFFATHSGNPAGQLPWNDPMGVSGGLNTTPGQTATGGTAPHGLGATAEAGFNQTATGAPTLPSYFGVPFRIVVSPFVHFDPESRLSDIYMFDSRQLGVLVVDHDVELDEFHDPSRDITKIKLKERYGIGILNEGFAIATMKNVHVVPNEIVLPAQAQITNIPVINPTDTVL